MVKNVKNVGLLFDGHLVKIVMEHYKKLMQVMNLNELIQFMLTVLKDQTKDELIVDSKKCAIGFKPSKMQSDSEKEATLDFLYQLAEAEIEIHPRTMQHYNGKWFEKQVDGLLILNTTNPMDQLDYLIVMTHDVDILPAINYVKSNSTMQVIIAYFDIPHSTCAQKLIDAADRVLKLTDLLNDRRYKQNALQTVQFQPVGKVIPNQTVKAWQSNNKQKTQKKIKARQVNKLNLQDYMNPGDFEPKLVLVKLTTIHASGNYGFCYSELVHGGIYVSSRTVTDFDRLEVEDLILGVLRVVRKSNGELSWQISGDILVVNDLFNQ